jgi:hypothetical protein
MLSVKRRVDASMPKGPRGQKRKKAAAAHWGAEWQLQSVACKVSPFLPNPKIAADPRVRPVLHPVCEIGF